MKNLWIAATLVAGLLASCRGGKNQGDNNLPDSTTISQHGDSAAPDEKKNYLPVAEFIKGDVGKVDSFSAGILMRTTIDGRSDSAFVKLEAFRKVVPLFLVPELDSAYFAENYSESTLYDPASETMSFIYTATNDQAPLKKAFVYVVQGYNNNKVSRIYLERELASGDTSLSQKLTWKMNEFCQVVETKRTSKGLNTVKVQKLIWEPSAFASE